MEKITNYYKLGKEKVAAYVKDMEDNYLNSLEIIERFESLIFDESDEYHYLEDKYESAKNFVKTWDVITKKLSPTDKNLILCTAVFKNYEEVLKVFNGIKNGKVKNKKNIASLTMAICRARKRLRDLIEK
jgi:hypothetical protein